ncbi:ParB/RepB/Spo0J family partition protein [Mesorhizobium sp.]|uniref:ParB/RepB/Spo0J family partition protein n=1 Tax=Mesorhizobium sp. TaxID=1871066 RepID=UPI0011F9D864|nr:ParB/RepB/Spo0J family partition protein [Mesorhizobium sp.]TIN76757.1 MAG: ParB/RepB/Spo0J family partition protein [Mesorhizobium sp.]
MTLQTRTAALADLELDDDINARRHRNDEGIEELKASIRAHGLAQSLRVRPAEKAGRFRIVAGSRRYRVLCELATSGDTAAGVPVTEEFPVPVIIGYEDDDQTAREISQAENLIRLPQHEADTYETFRELADRGLDEGQIASRFGIDPKRVKRMLALGRLSPLILDAWREGWFRDRAIETVRAFTLAASVAEQERVFALAKKSGGAQPWWIKEQFGAGDRNVAKLMKFVGIDAYVAAGGIVVEDLFEEDHAVSDPALVAKLAAERLQTHVKQLIADGWSWASIADELPGDWFYAWKKLPASKKKATKADKAKSGAVVKLDYQGNLEITYGLIKPAAEAAKAAKAEGPKEKSAPKISDALHQRLSVQATMATQQALSAEPRLGLIFLLAGHLASRSASPIKAYHEGMAWRASDAREDFTAAVDRLTAMSDAELFRVAAGIAGHSVDLHTPEARTQIFGGHRRSLVGAIDAERMTGALLEKFDAADYFGGASKPFVITAIREALNDDEARRADKMKKAELTAFALANVPQTGWLPPELRAPTYSGPGEIPDLAEAPPTEPDDDDLVDDEVEEDEAA